MIVHLHIDRLVVDTAGTVDSRVLEASLAIGLARAIAEGSLPPMLLVDATFGRLDAALTRTGGSTASRGETVGRSIHAALAEGKAVGAPLRGAQ